MLDPAIPYSNRSREARESDARDADLFVRLVRQHERRMLGFAVSLLANVADAEDVLQEAITLMWERFGEFDPQSDFTAWAFRVLRFKILECRRGNQRLGFLLSDEMLDKIAAEAQQMEPLLERQSRALAQCLEQLPPRDSDLTQKRYRAGVTMGQLTALFGLSEVTLRKHLRRILAGLKRCVQTKLAQEE